MPPYTERIQLRSPTKSDQKSVNGSSKSENGMNSISKKSAPQFKVEVSLTQTPLQFVTYSNQF